MKQHLALLAGSAALALLAGCGTTSEYVDATDTTIAVKNNDRMSSSDWVKIVSTASDSMLSSPLFKEYLEEYQSRALREFTADPNNQPPMPARLKKPLLMLSSIRNNTGEHIDVTLMTNRLRESLFNSGLVRFTTYAAGSGQDIDTATGGVKQLSQDPNVKKSAVTKKHTVNAYDLSLSGSITRQTAQSGRSNELSYMFTLTLTDNLTGEGVWTYTEEIKRQHTSPGIGW